MADLFNNTSNNYVDPNLAACRGSGEDLKFEYVDGGIGIVSGTSIIAKIDYSEISIAVDSWNQQQLVINPGEVVFVQGLTKGIINQSQTFDWPNLTSTDTDLDKLFMIIDLSINYYDTFSFTIKALDASSDYTENLAIDDALNIEFGVQGITVGSSYDASALGFTSAQAGYQFDITNITLTLIDTSENSLSPFPNVGATQTYDLIEDISSAIGYAKYPNTASQGLTLKGKYPEKYKGVTIFDWEKWILINHVPNEVATYTPIILDFDTSVNVNIVYAFDGSTFLGNKSTIIDDVSIADVSANYDVSIAEIIVPDVSNAIIDSSTLTNLFVLDSSITNSIIDSSVYSDSIIIDSSLINTVYLLRTDVSTGSINGLNNLALGDSSSYNSFNNVTMDGIVGIDLQYYNVGNLVLSASTYSIDVQDSYVYNISGDASIRAADSSIINVSSDITAYNSIIVDSSTKKLVSDQSSIYRISLGNFGTTTLNTSKIYDSSIYDNVKIQDTSIFTSLVTALLDQSYISDSSLINSTITQSEIFQSRIWDSSLAINTVINQDSSITDSKLNNVWTNTFVLNGSTYVMEDDTLDIDTSAWRVNINNSEIWDSSINNTTIYDSSIYRTYFQDSSLVRCTIYNCIFEDSVEIDTRTILIDASIVCDVSILLDSSTYYDRVVKTVDVGLSGCSSDSTLSGGDYLEWVSDNDFWKKIGDLYTWTSPPDFDNDPTLLNLIKGFYVYNNHTFPVQIEYIVFV